MKYLGSDVDGSGDGSDDAAGDAPEGNIVRYRTLSNYYYIIS